MFYPTKKEFIKLAKKGNLIPVHKEIVADMETPVSAYQKDRGRVFFFARIGRGRRKDRPLFFPGDLFRPRVLRPKTFEDIRQILKRYRPVKLVGLPRFCGGLVGYVSYDAVRQIEKLPDKNPDDLRLPLMQFILADDILAFDHIKHKILIIANAHVNGRPEKAYAEACARIKRLESRLKKPLRLTREEFEVPSGGVPQGNMRSNLTKPAFESMVRRAKEHIRAGDIIQVVLSQRFEQPCDADPFNIYRVLRIINPSPYMYYLKLGEERLIGSSPEVMVRLENGVATVRPIAGTRPRGVTEEADRKLALELLASRKEKAEHIMLVDLGRNDLGRVCDFGSVRVTEAMVIERYSHVMHIVSNVAGRLKKSKDAVDLLRACFPAGTVSGAPKVRAMEIIDELENVRRGTYAGCVGYLSFAGDLDTAITIRTILLKGKRAFVQAGAGIVADSAPAREYQETVNKARALLSAIALAR